MRFQGLPPELHVGSLNLTPVYSTSIWDRCTCATCYRAGPSFLICDAADHIICSACAIPSLSRIELGWCPACKGQASFRQSGIPINIFAQVLFRCECGFEGILAAIQKHLLAERSLTKPDDLNDVSPMVRARNNNEHHILFPGKGLAEIPRFISLHRRERATQTENAAFENSWDLPCKMMHMLYAIQTRMGALEKHIVLAKHGLKQQTNQVDVITELERCFMEVNERVDKIENERHAAQKAAKEYVFDEMVPLITTVVEETISSAPFRHHAETVDSEKIRSVAREEVVKLKQEIDKMNLETIRYEFKREIASLESIANAIDSERKDDARMLREDVNTVVARVEELADSLIDREAHLTEERVKEIARQQLMLTQYRLESAAVTNISRSVNELQEKLDAIKTRVDTIDFNQQNDTNSLKQQICIEANNFRRQMATARTPTDPVVSSGEIRTDLHVPF